MAEQNHRSGLRYAGLDSIKLPAVHRAVSASRLEVIMNGLDPFDERMAENKRARSTMDDKKVRTIKSRLSIIFSNKHVADCRVE
jgi:hypothetical protein